MILINKSEDMIIASINGAVLTRTFNEEVYDTLKTIETTAESATSMEDYKGLVEEATKLMEEDYSEILTTKYPELYISKTTGKYHLKYNDVISSKAIPQALVDKIIASFEAGIDSTPIIKCWVRFMRNVNFTDDKADLFAAYITASYTDEEKIDSLMNEKGLSLEVATKMATTSQVAITKEGLIVGYKVSREVTSKFAFGSDGKPTTVDRYEASIDEDTGLVTYNTPEFVEDRVFEPAVVGNNYDAFYCGDKLGHIIKVGHAIKLESWEQVDTDDRHLCVKGLHVGGLSYIKGYQSTGTVTHNIFIDPADIGAICCLSEYSDGAMRVIKYFVHSSFDGVNKNIYHSSDYAKITDEEYKAYLAEAVVKFNEDKIAIDNASKEAQSLI